MRTIALSILICLLACQSNKMNNNQTHPYIVVLGIAQDAGYPQANCNKQCCQKAWENKNLTKYVWNLLINSNSNAKIIISQI